ncbi:BOS complex subunit NCLN-like [Penaeus indicus]|uniref:BOS complex subunit NCLN-like n=1 Tax=Penaeus indicus TaxID=29960 RepID=UPI00300C85A1
MCLNSLRAGGRIRMHVPRNQKITLQHIFSSKGLEEIGTKSGIRWKWVPQENQPPRRYSKPGSMKVSMRRLPAFTVPGLPMAQATLPRECVWHDHICPWKNKSPHHGTYAHATQNIVQAYHDMCVAKKNSWDASKTGERGSILDTPDSVDVDALTRNTAVIATSLLQHIYNTSVDEIFSEGLDVTRESVQSWLDLMSSQPRSPQLLSGKNNPLVSTLHQVLSRYTNEARVTYVKADKRDPEWAFYDVTKTTMAAYAVKPAAFDFLLTLAILSYLGVIYVFLQYFPKIYVMMARITSPRKSKVH